MTELFITENKDLYGKAEMLLKQHAAAPVKILHSPNEIGRASCRERV